MSIVDRRLPAPRLASLTLAAAFLFFAGPSGRAQLAVGTPVMALAPALRQGRQLLADSHFQEAREVFAAYLQKHPEDPQAELGLGDAEMGLGHSEAAELAYRVAVAKEPQLWQGHKDLVVAEAALGRWDEFDREREVLRSARLRGANGISTRESDVIDRFVLAGERWVVRAYFEPVGRARARYNFEHFSPSGRVVAYVSLEDAEAAQAALTLGDERIGAKDIQGAANSETAPLALNWYTGAAHGTIRRYTSGEPPYQDLRRDVTAWLRRHPEILRPGSHE